MPDAFFNPLIALEVSTLSLSSQRVETSYTPNSQGDYTPNTQAKLYAKYTGKIRSHTRNTQAKGKKIYAKYTGEFKDLLSF